MPLRDPMAFNLKISKLRKASIATALEETDIDAGRIAVESKGGTVQPFFEVEQDRMYICITQ